MEDTCKNCKDIMQIKEQASEVDEKSGKRFVDIKNALWNFYRGTMEFEPVRSIYDKEDYFINELPNLIGKLDPRFSCDQVIKSGSISEGVNLFRLYSEEEVIDHEFDFLYLVTALEVNRVDVISFESSEVTNTQNILKPSHALISLSDDKAALWNDCAVNVNDVVNDFDINNLGIKKIMSPKRVVDVFQNIVFKAAEGIDFLKECIVRKEINGPAVTLIIDYYKGNVQSTYSIDFVLALKSPRWSTDAATWSKRSRIFPDVSVVESILSGGVFFVPKASTDEREDYEWRVSFSSAEHKLMSMIFEGESSLNQEPKNPKYKVPLIALRNTIDTKCKREVFRLLKFLIKKHLSKPKVIISYHLKTLFLWYLEQLPESSWNRSYLAHRFLEMLDIIEISLGNGFIEHYFVPGCDLLDKADVKEVDATRKILQGIRVSIMDYFPHPNQELLKDDPYQLTYSDTFVEDSEAMEMKVAQLMLKNEDTEMLNENFDQVTPLYSMSYSYTTTNTDPYRKVNTYMRK